MASLSLKRLWNSRVPLIGQVLKMVCFLARSLQTCVGDHWLVALQELILEWKTTGLSRPVRMYSLRSSNGRLSSQSALGTSNILALVPDIMSHAWRCDIKSSCVLMTRVWHSLVPRPQLGSRLDVARGEIRPHPCPWVINTRLVDNYSFFLLVLSKMSKLKVGKRHIKIYCIDVTCKSSLVMETLRKLDPESSQVIKLVSF